MYVDKRFVHTVVFKSSSINNSFPENLFAARFVRRANVTYRKFALLYERPRADPFRRIESPILREYAYRKFRTFFIRSFSRFQLCVFGLALIVRGSAAVSPLSYLLQYKRSILGSPNGPGLDGLSAYNSFGGAPLNFGGYGQGFATYSPGVGLPVAYGFGDLRLHQTRGFGGSPVDFQYAGAPQPSYGFDAFSAGYPFVASPVQFKVSPPSPFAPLPQSYALTVNAPQVPRVEYKTVAPKTLPPSNGAPQSVPVTYSNEPTRVTIQNAQTSAPQPVPYSANGQPSNPNDVPPTRPIQDVRQQQVRVSNPKNPADGPATVRFQTPDAYYQPASIGGNDAVTPPSPSAFAPGTESPSDLYLELRPPPYTETPVDYSSSNNGGPSSSSSSSSSSSASDGSHTDFVGSNTNQAPDKNHMSAPYTLPENSLAGGQYREPYPAPDNAYKTPSVPIASGASSSSYLIPSVSYTLTGDTYTPTDPNGVNSYYYGSVPVESQSKTGPKSSHADAGNNFAAGNSPGVPSSVPVEVYRADSTGPVTKPFASAYYKTPINIPSDTYRDPNPTSTGSYGNSNPTSANSYGDSNTIQSGPYGSAGNSYGDVKVIPGNDYGGDSNSISANKRESSTFDRPKQQGLVGLLL